MDPTARRQSVNPRVLVGKILLVNGIAFGSISLLLGGFSLFSQPDATFIRGGSTMPVTVLLAVIFAGVALLEALVGLVLWLSPGGASPTAQVVNRYYAALEDQNYATAFQQLDLSIGAPFGPAITQTEFIEKARAHDTEHGNVINYALVGVQAQPSNRLYTIKVTRLGEGSYRARLRLTKRGDTWKIIGFDRF